MSARRQTSFITAAVLIVSLAAAVVMLGPLERAQRAGHSDTEDVLYIPSARAIRAMSLGYTGLAADIYWTRVVQYFGRRHQDAATTFPLLEPLLRLTTDLDPHMIVAYQFGSIFLVPPPPSGAGQPDKAVDLVERGIKANPNEWRLYLSLGFIHYEYRHDLAAAEAAFERGSRVPGAHPALRILAATVSREGGDEKKAAILWRAIYDTTYDKSIRKSAMEHLIALQVDAEVTRLEQLVQQFQERNGRPPSNFAELVASGWLPKLPIDPIGEPYKLMPDGRVEVSLPSYLPFISKGLPEGTKSRIGIPIPGMQR